MSKLAPMVGLVVTNIGDKSAACSSPHCRLNGGCSMPVARSLRFCPMMCAATAPCAPSSEAMRQRRSRSSCCSWNPGFTGFPARHVQRSVIRMPAWPGPSPVLKRGPGSVNRASSPPPARRAGSPSHSDLRCLPGVVPPNGFDWFPVRETGARRLWPGMTGYQSSAAPDT